MSVEHDHHGNTPAAWAGTIIILLGTLVACYAVMVPNAILGAVAAVAIVVGGIVWLTMEKGNANTK